MGHPEFNVPSCRGGAPDLSRCTRGKVSEGVLRLPAPTPACPRGLSSPRELTKTHVHTFQKALRGSMEATLKHKHRHRSSLRNTHILKLPASLQEPHTQTDLHLDTRRGLNSHTNTPLGPPTDTQNQYLKSFLSRTETTDERMNECTI